MNACRATRRLLAVVTGGCALVVVAASAQLPPPVPQPETRRAPALIAFVAAGDIHTIGADGSDRRRLTTTKARVYDESPVFSPDGRTIAFHRYDRTVNPAIWLVNRDGSGLRPLTPGAERGTEQSSPAWSPDGQRLAFTRLREDSDLEVAELVSIAADGSDERVVHREANPIETSAYFWQTAWSPSGDRIMFTRELLGGRATADFRPSLHVVPAAGGQARRVLANAAAATWSPSGDRIAYESAYERNGRPCGRTCLGTGEIVVANADGSGRIRLTKSPASDSSPSWSGDGLRIGFHSDRNSVQAEDEESPTELYSIRADGTCLTWLTNGTAHSQAPDFERGPGLSSDPGGCGAVPREPLIETDTSPASAQRTYPVWWLGLVAPNGLLLTDVEARRTEVWFGYHDCGRFDPKECGDFVNVTSHDLCADGRQLATAGRPSTSLSLARGVLLSETKGDESGRTQLYTHRSRILMDTASGFAVGRGLIDGLRQFGREDATSGTLPSTRLPVAFWRELGARRGVSRREAARRRAVARRLAQLGVKRRLGC